MARGNYDKLSYGQPHELCNSRGYRREDSGDVFKTRLASMDEVGRNRTSPEDDAMDTPGASAGKRDWSPADVVDILGGSLGNRGRRCRVGDLHSAFFADKEVVRGPAQWRHPDLKVRRDATRPSAVERVDDAISAWTTEECICALGQEVTEDEGKFHGGPASAAKERELNDWKKFKVPGY